MIATPVRPNMRSGAALVALLALLLVFEPATHGLRAELAMSLATSQGDSSSDETEGEGEGADAAAAKVATTSRRVAVNYPILRSKVASSRSRPQLFDGPVWRAFRPAPNGLGFPLRC